MASHSGLRHSTTAADSPRPSVGFRADVQGLRAIAVLLVVLYHAGLPGLPGGFVGVDVFFVISGFLITTHLLQSLEREGRIRFGAFYARRARRILPAALLVALLTLIAARIWMSPLLMEEVARGAVAAALYVPNYLFAAEGTDYLAEATPSVFQHYWSLGIEEQFYLLWPALLAGGFVACRRREVRLMALVATLTAISFLACVLWMDVSQPWTFFSLPTRAWELGAGGLVAFLLRTGARWLRSARTGLLAWVGLAGLLTAALGFDDGTDFPGWTAALPVVATAAMIVGGAAPGGLHATRLLALPPLQFLGALSYSLYLVHWPLQVIPRAALFSEEPLSIGITMMLAAAALPCAWLLYRWVERPAMTWRPLREGPSWATGAVALAASLALIATSVGMHRATELQPLAAAATAAPPSQEFDPSGTDVVPANVSPALDEITGDNPAIYASGCHRDERSIDPSGCRVGEVDDAPLVFLVGDSHAASWYPALERLAREGRIRLDSNTKSSCLPLEIEQQREGRPYPECAQWREGVLTRIEREQPDLVILAGYQNPEQIGDGSTAPTTGEDLAALWRDGLAATLERINGPQVAVMQEVPHQRRAPAHCLAKNPQHAHRCAEPRTSAFNSSLDRAEDAAVVARGSVARRVDLSDYLCNAQTCPVVIGDTVVFRDGHHLTQTFSRELAAPLWQQLEPMLG